MAGKSIVELLRETFPASTQEDWKHAASQEIEGQNPYTKLAWKNADELTFLPYYDESNVATLSFLKGFILKPGTGHYGHARQWLNLSPVNVANEVTANAQALDHLQQGADGILFDLPAGTSYHPAKLLQKIEWPYCAVAFRIHSYESFQPLRDFITSSHYKPDALTGAIFWNKVPETKDVFLPQLLEQTNFSSLGSFVLRSSPAAEICDALISGVRFFSIAEDQNLSPEKIAQLVAFSFPTENNFLQTIGKLKVARMLWFQVVRAYGVRGFTPDKLHLHARSEPWVDEKFQPHGNMLSGTISALAAITGGCDSLTVHPEDENNITMGRIARNISAILREESHVDKVADPMAGSYVLDVMVNDLARKAWSLFQSAVQKL